MMTSLPSGSVELLNLSSVSLPAYAYKLLTLLMRNGGRPGSLTTISFVMRGL